MIVCFYRSFTFQEVGTPSITQLDGANITNTLRIYKGSYQSQVPSWIANTATYAAGVAEGSIVLVAETDDPAYRAAPYWQFYPGDGAVA